MAFLLIINFYKCSFISQIALLSNSFSSIYWFIFSAIILSSIWLLVKQMTTKNIKFEKETHKLQNFKRNFNFFQFLAKSIEEYDDFDKLKGISFGNQNAITQLTLIVSLDDKNSINDFKEAYILFKNNSEKVYLNILFHCNPNTHGTPNKVVIENLLALNEQDVEKAKEALVDWFIHQYGIKKWTKKWEIETPYLLVHKQLQNQYYWCLKNEFNHTPIKIINGNLFPEEYEIKDLNYFIHDFEEEFEMEEALKAV